MSDHPPTVQFLPHIASSTLWKAALLFALVNTLFMVRRTAFQHTQELHGDSAAVESIAKAMRTVPADARVLLFRSHADPRNADLGAVWFAYRYNYLVYPRHCALAWEVLPESAAQRFDLLITFGSACHRVPASWILLKSSGNAALFASADYGSDALKAGWSPQQQRRLTLTGVLAGMAALAVGPLLGLLLCGWTCGRGPFRTIAGNLAIAHIVGAGALTWLLILTALVTGRLSIWPVYVLLLVLAPGLRRAKSWLTTPGSTATGVAGGSLPMVECGEIVVTTTRSTVQSTGDFSRIWQGISLALAALSLLALLQRAWLIGIGWDAYSIWQFKAAAFVHDGNLSVLRDGLYSYYAHMDYPLLVPLQTWWVCSQAGGYQEGWAQLIGVVFVFDLAAIFASFAMLWTARSIALMGVSLVIGLPLLTVHGVSGFADIEMACCLLAVGVVAVMVTWDRKGNWHLLAWLLGATVLVKNEGLLAVCVTVLLMLWLRRNGPASSAAAGAALFYLPWLAIKRAWRLQNDLLESGHKPRFSAGLLLWRFGVTLKSIGATLASPKPPCWGLVGLLFAVGLFETFRRKIGAARPLWALCGLQLCGYVGIYLITPQPVISHLGSSLGRLLLHLVPTLLLASLLGCFARSTDC